MVKPLPEGYNEPTFKLGYILGVLVGDGSLHKEKHSGNYRICLCTTNEDFADEFANALQKWGLNAKVFGPYETSNKLSDKPQYDVVAYGREAFNFFKNQLDSGKVPVICLDSDECLMGFLSGFVDSDGCVSRYKTSKKKKLCISFTNSDTSLLSAIKSKLEEIGFEPGKIYDTKSGDSLKNKPVFAFSLCAEKAERLKKEIGGFKICG